MGEWVDTKTGVEYEIVIDQNLNGEIVENSICWGNPNDIDGRNCLSGAIRAKGDKQTIAFIEYEITLCFVSATQPEEPQKTENDPNAVRLIEQK